MAYSKSGWFVQTLMYALSGTAQTGTPTTIALIGNDANLKLALTSSACTDYTAPVNTVSATLGVWTNTNEITGSGWVTGGIALNALAAGSTSVTSTCVIGGAGPAYVQYSWTNAASVASTTLTGIYGFIIYFQSITAPLNKPELLTIYVGTGYNTVSGTLGITPSGSGLSQITLTA
jgi:hypothetical protein